MTSDRSNDEMLSNFKDVISVLEKNLKYVTSLGVDAVLLQDYRRVISYLKARPVSEIGHIIGSRPPVKEPRPSETTQLTDEEIVNLTSEQVGTLLQSHDLTRSVLERIASIRFSVTKGALSALKRRDALIDKLTTLLSHEGTHDSISRAVRSSQERHDE